MNKLTFDFVKNKFLESGCELLETNYINNSQPLRYICSCGNEATTRWNDFRSGSRCKNCGHNKSTESKRCYTLEWVKNKFVENGCELLEDNYVNNYTSMKYKCCCGNISYIRLFCLIKGQRCRECSKPQGESHYRWNPDRELVELNKTLQRRGRHLVEYVFGKTGKFKSDRKSRLLGYNTSDLKNHLQSFPEWNSLKNCEWHIDHIFPIKAFIDHGVHDIKLINCLENLRPLKAKDNLVKNDKYDVKEFEAWLSSKL